VSTLSLLIDVGFISDYLLGNSGDYS